MKIKNNKGFTMVELLAAIVILGILSAVAIGAVSWILQRSRENYYVTLEKNVTMAGENYYVDNRASLPKSIGQNRRILLKTLVDKKYLPEVLDYNKNDCTASSDSYIKVVKYSESDYLYTAYFDCPGYKTSEEEQIKDINIQIDFDYSERNINNSTATIKISSTEDNRIASYEYTIYKDGQHVYQSENINAGYVDSINREIKLERYVPGNIRIVVTAYDIYGNKKIVNKEVAIYKSDVPECGEIDPLYKKWETTAGTSRSISVGCVDTGVKCLRPNFSETFSSDTEKGYITIKGENNEERKCPVNVYIDSTPPTCGNNNGSTVWTKGDREITLNCIDETSGCEKDPYKETYSKTTTTADIKIKDKAGNSTKCQVNVYVDKQKPTCGPTKVENTSAGRKVTVLCSDGESGCKQEQYEQIINNNTTSITIEDNAGNTRACDITAEADKTAPSCPRISPSQNQRSWTNKDISFNFTFTSDTANWDWYTDSNGTYKFWTNNKPTVRSKTLSGEGKRKIKVIVYDKAGNKQECFTDHEYWIDQTKPTCGTITEQVISSSRREVSIRCNDDASGCKQQVYTKSISNSASSITIEDKAGNTRSCSIPAKTIVDNNPPSCPSISASQKQRTWTNKDIKFNFGFTKDTESWDWYTDSNGAYKFWTNNKASVTTKTLSGEGRRKIKVIVYDKVGNKQECFTNHEYWIDQTKPTCGALTETEVSGGRKVTIKCNDDASGCKQQSYTKNVDNNASSITISDNAGNTRSCSIPKKTVTDKTPPNCPTINATTAQKTWTKNDITFTFGFTSDTASWDWYTDSNGSYKFWDNNATSANSKTISGEGKRKIKVVVYDKAGNSRECFTNHEYWIDKTGPSCPSLSSTVAQKTWTNKDITFTFGFTSDTESWDWYTDSNGSYKFWDNNATSKTSKPISGAGKRKIKVIVYDKAGNKRECFTDHEYWIDKTKPVLKYEVQETGGDKRKITGNSRDGSTSANRSWTAYSNVTRKFTYEEEGGSGFDYAEYNTGSGWTREQNFSSYTATKSFNTRYRVKDKAGNYSNEIKLNITISPNKKMYFCRDGNTFIHWRKSLSCANVESNRYNCSYYQTSDISSPRSVTVKAQLDGDYYVLVNPVKKTYDGEPFEFKYIYKGCLVETSKPKNCTSACKG